MKGPQVFAEAARGIPRDQAQFRIAGPASLGTQHHLQQLSGDGRLEFLGPYTRRDLPAILDGLDVVVVPSVVQETVGLVALEAQAAGAPVIAARIGALPEYVEDEQNGLLFTPGDAADLRAKMMRLIDNPSLVAEMSARTRPPATLNAHVEALLDTYTQVKSKGGSALWTHSSA